MTLAALLKEKRAEKQLTQLQVCERADISYNTYHAYENSKIKNPGFENMSKLIKALSINKKELKAIGYFI